MGILAINSEKQGKVMGPKQIGAGGCLSVVVVERKMIGEPKSVQLLVDGGRNWDHSRSEPGDGAQVGLMTTFSKPRVRTCDKYE